MADVAPNPRQAWPRPPPVRGATPRRKTPRNNPERTSITMATAAEIQAQIDAEKQAHARRVAELEREKLTAEHDDLTELITTHANALPEDEIEGLELAQIRHDVTRLKADLKVAKKVLEQVSAIENGDQNRVNSDLETGSEMTQ